MMRIEPLGDQALLLTLGDSIDPIINRRVYAYYRMIREVLGEDITSIIPAYASIAVGFNPLFTNRKDLIEKIQGLVVSDEERQGKLLQLPVCYHPDFGIDLEDVSKLSGLDQADIVKIHTDHEFQVYMLGFVPGFVYMGIVPEVLQFARRQSPRLEVPPGSVALAGEQTGIYPSASPGGWHIIGRTPIPLLSKEGSTPSPFTGGDHVRFQEIDLEEYGAIQEEVVSNTFDMTSLIAQG